MTDNQVIYAASPGGYAPPGQNFVFYAFVSGWNIRDAFDRLPRQLVRRKLAVVWASFSFRRGSKKLQSSSAHLSSCCTCPPRQGESSSVPPPARPRLRTSPTVGAGEQPRRQVSRWPGFITTTPLLALLYVDHRFCSIPAIRTEIPSSSSDFPFLHYVVHFRVGHRSSSPSRLRQS